MAIARAATPGNSSTTNLLEEARTDFLAGHLDSALTKLDQRDKVKTPDADSLDLRGAVNLEQQKLDLAERAFTEANKLQPELFAPRLHRADLFLRTKKYAEAREIYAQLVLGTNVLISNERARYGLFISVLASHDETAAGRALANIKFPTQTPAYYYAQAAAEFAQGHERSAKKWLATASEIFDAPTLAWFARPLYDLGWLKDKTLPAL